MPASLRRALLFCLVGGAVLIGSRAARAQSTAEQGRPFLRTYTSQTYGAHPQNFRLDVGPEGLLYAANARGVLTYDGERWRLIDVAGQTVARSLAHRADGTTFVGGQGEIGRLVPDGAGGQRYVSLLDRVPESQRDFGQVWRTHAVGDTVYFAPQRRLFRWHNGQMTSWEGPFLLSFTVRNTMYVQRRGGALCVVRGDSLRALPGTADLPTIYFAVPLGPDALLLGTWQRGLLRYEDGRVTSWDPEAETALTQNRPYTGAALPGDGVAIGTHDGGVFVYDADGTLRRRVDRTSGLNDNYVHDLHLDRQGGLWIAHSRGLARVELHRALTRYGTAEGLSGNVFDVARVDGRLYAGTMDGLFVLRPAEAAGQTGRFERLDVPPVAHDLMAYEDRVLVGTEAGLFQVDGSRIERIGSASGPPGAIADLALDPRNPSRLYVGRRDGLAVYERRGGRWDRQHHMEVGRLSHLATAPSGTLWAGTEASSVIRLTPTDPTAGITPDAPVSRYDTTDGLPSMRANLPYRVDDRIVVGTSDGPYRFDPAAGRFEPDPQLRASLPQPSRYVEPIVEDRDGRVWMRVGETDRPVTGRLQPREDGTYTWAPGRLQRLAGFNTFEIQHDGPVTWIGGPGFGPEALLVRYAPDRTTTANPDYEGPPALLRRATLLNADSALALSGGPDDDPLRLAYAQNALRFTYAAPAFDAPDDTQYRVRLDGYDASWSPWRSASEATYTNLPPGTYTVRVQARDVYRRRGPEARLAFTILPPWYRTWWAYGGAVLLLLGLGVAAVRWRTQQLRRRQDALEQTVAARTDEIRRQRDQLKEQAEQLEALDEAKSRFFANVSHEFRTPLTLILGPVRRLRRRFARLSIEALPDEDAVDQLGIVERNAARLLRMVQQILDLARYDAGTIDLEAHPTDPAPEIERIVQAFAPLAERQALTLSVHAEPLSDDGPPVYLDGAYLEQILGNLLSNAIKFTPAGGRVTVRVTPRADAVQIQVRDTGPGMSPEVQARIFDRFVQADDTATRAQEGAGIGLALAHTLVDLHGGTIDVESTEGEGTTFTIAIPRGRDHLADDQIADDQIADESERDVSSTAEDDGPASLPERSPHDEPRLESTSARTADPGETARPRSSAEADDESEGASPTSPLVLVVDDNADVRRYVRSVLEPAFRVVEAATGREGLTAARERLPDVILADVMMPEMDGLTMTERLRADDRTAAIPIVMLTARAGTEDEVEGLSAGATDYVVKPFDPQVLEMRVRGTLAYQERLRRRLLAEIEEADTDPDAEPRSDRSAFEREIRSVAAQHLPDPDFGVSDLADALAVSRSTLYRRARDADAPAPAELLRTMRLERGAELLRDGAGTVSEVAYAVGYRSLSHFSTQFADHFGQSPTAYGADDA